MNQSNIMDPALEIRKLPPSIVRELAQKLDHADLWKRLMSIIPKKLSTEGYICDIKPDNLQKYNSGHIKIIEQENKKSKRPCTEILFSEWGTSGRPRATLGHLKYLLTKAELFRAADYVARILNEAPPVRPNTGPAAFVPVTLTESARYSNTYSAEREDNMNGPIHPIRENNQISDERNCPLIPEIVVSDVDNAHRSPSRQAVQIENPYLSDVSDMMKFSKNSINEEQSAILPDLSDLLQQSSIKESEQACHVPSFQFSSSQEIIPAFSKILNGPPSEIQSDHPIPSLPLLSELQKQYSGEIENDLPLVSALYQNLDQNNSDVRPNNNMVQSNTSQNSKPSFSISRPASDSYTSSGSFKCPSPLPNLSLNTQLPHFTYAQLEAATNNFNENPYSSEKENGRLLGRGAFGSVFLAIGLLDEPVAVKKIFLENVEVVNEDDEVTKRFKNEVEYLSKYKHENLVTLLGYSCDGCTYCLIYEYIPGGALFDVIGENPQSLSWKQRILIALGTAKAVAYLHTALTTPLIHRDIKSANILLDESSNPKLCDFGIVKLLPSQKTDIQTALYGTSAYMSPEYQRGDISIKLDTFSFGVVLLELLTSLPPLDYNREGADLVTYFENNCEESIYPILDQNVGAWEENNINFANELYKLTFKCLDDKRKRPEMIEVVEALEKIKASMS